MTKEELEKEAEEFTDSKKSFWRQGRTCIDSVKQAYLAGAEPREKRIAELEVQIEQMKKYLDCDFCEHQNNKDECHQCNYLEKTRWTLKKEIKEK